jgi:Spy/CpxP family protein refolding chaperone
MSPRLKLTLLCTGIFLAGLAAGVLGARRFAPPRLGGGGPEGFAPQHIRRLAAELELTPSQRATLEPVMRQAGTELRALQGEGRDKARAILEQMEIAVQAELTPAQREKFAALKAQQRERMKRMLEQRPHRTGPNPEAEPPRPPR